MRMLERETVERCPYCAHTALSLRHAGLHDRLGISAESWSWLSCNACGAGLLSPRPAAQALKAYYPENYSFPAAPPPGAGLFFRLLHAVEKNAFHAPMARTRARRILELYRQHSAQPKPASAVSLLEIGCGSGLVIEACLRLGMQVQATDFDERRTRRIAEVLGIPAQAADAAALTPYTGQKFHIIAAFHLLEHLPDPEAALARWRELLAPGGCIILGLPMMDSLQAALLKDKWLSLRECPRHLTLPARESLEALARRGGFAMPAIRAEGLLSASADMALSLMPAASNTRLGAHAPVARLAWRLANALAMLACLPVAAYGNYGLRRPVNACICLVKQGKEDA